MSELAPHTGQEPIDLMRQKQLDIDVGPALGKRQVDVGLDGAHFIGDEDRGHQDPPAVGDRVVGLRQV